MKNNKKFILSSFITILMVLSLFVLVRYTVSAVDIDIENTISGMAIQKTIIKPYTFKSSAYDKIAIFPIDAYVFNSNADFFCAQHGTSYGRTNRRTTLAPEFHTGHVITKHKVAQGYNDIYFNNTWNYYSNDPKGDVDDTANIYLNTSGQYVLKNNYTYQSYREYNETGDSLVYTNWVYNLQTITFDCETAYSSNEITDGGMAFLLACYKQTDAERASTGYNNDPLQFAVWDWLGQLGSKPNPLKEAALSYQQYHEMSKEPNVDTIPESNVGTTTNSSMTSYSVGPFKMSNYLRAEDFIYDEKGSYHAVVHDSTIENNTITDIYNMDINNTGVDLQSTFDKYGSGYDGTIIKAEAVVTNESGATKKIPFAVPDPNEEYYINLSAAAIEGYDELLDVIFTYQRIHASGNGTKYIGYQEAVNFTEKSGTATDSGCTYYCQHQTPSYASHSTSSYGRWQWCTYTWDCDAAGAPKDSSHYCDSDHWYSYCSCDGWYCPYGQHLDYVDHSDCDHWNSEYNCDYVYYDCDDCTPDCAGDHSCYSYCNCPGHSDSHWSYFLCSHQHEECKIFTWNKPPSHWPDYAQDGLAASGALQTEQIEYKIRVSVPMKTKMAIYKYITNVEHVGESITTYSGGTERREMSMGDKYNNSVKVEKGDLVTYKVEIINDSRFPTMVKVEDTLPEPCSDEEMADAIRNSSWITVEPYSKNEYTITLRPNASSGKYTNTIEFITRNDTNPTMRNSYWYNDATHGAHSNGSIVNIYTKEKDSDTYEIKEYNVSLQKYIYDVTHNQENIKVSNIDTTMGPSLARRRGSMTEQDKQNGPVYVEYGDTVTYEIMVYNTTDSVDDEFDISDREAAPYWEPDKAYVTIQDTLPKKYSNLSVTVSGTGTVGNSSHSISSPGEESNSGGTLIISDLMVPAGGYRKVTITLTVEEYTKSTVEVNDATFIGGIKNINRGPNRGATTASKYCVIQNNSSDVTSRDYYKLNDYNISLNKFLYKYDESVLSLNNTNGFTAESSIIGADNIIITPRENETEAYRREHPVNVEQTESLTYIIKAKNEAIGSGSGTSAKHATQVRTTKVTDYMQQGLQLVDVTAKMYDSGGNIVTRYAADGSVSVSHSLVGSASVEGNLCDKYEFTIGNETILNPGEYIEYSVEVVVTKSNMYLYSLVNKAELFVLTNVNNSDESSYIVKDDTHNENIASQQSSSDYVRMKDLVISGQVWLDINRDGLMNDRARSDLEKINNGINDSAKKKDVVVNLYQVGIAEPIRTTKTDSNGLYTFGRDAGFSWYSTYNHTTGYSAGTKYQRIDKANGKDGNGNYTGSSQYLSYYVEFEYDGVLYKSTEIYAGMDNLNNDGTYNSTYLIDSNAREYEADRKAFNKVYEYISYNVAYDESLNKSGDLVFQKDGNASYLMEDTARKMTAKSFVEKDADEINYLWLFPFPGADYTKPETDYLKHIHLGLELREDVDLELSKDVYKVKTTINGEEMEYDYNLGYTTEYLNDYIIKKPYGFEVYESDYKYRVDQFFADAVRAYKGINGEDELNIEVTFRINLENKSTKDDDEVEGSLDTKLNVRVHEVLDLYDENFMKLTFNNGIVTNENNTITVKEKGDNGFLVDKQISIGEAWMFMEESAVPAGLTKSTEKYVITNLADVNNGTAKPNYKEDASGTIVKAYLTIADHSSRGANGAYSVKANGNDFTADGYNTAYIRGMENIIIPEGTDLDIYVKYVVDKDNLLTTIQNEEFNEVDQSVYVESVDDGLVSGKITSVEILSATEARIERSLKLADIRVDAGNPYKQQYGRGTENIAQINAYSVWYTNGEPASLVDKDSNAGNLGIQNLTTGTSPKSGGYSEDDKASADNIEFYEDTTYKTGIEIAAEGSENTKKEVNDKYGTIFGEVEDQILREISGKVWDDSRSEILSETTITEDMTQEQIDAIKDKQYIGNGLYTNEEDGDNRDIRHTEAKHNESLAKLYKLGEAANVDVDETHDLLVRNAKAEFIEIVQVPVMNGENVSEVRYYEQVLMGVTWEQVQSMRTDANGEYHLKGLKPGNYIVRFTYGDTIEGNEEVYNKDLQAQKDMLIFNGQDYKSTVYNPHLEDLELDVDEVIRRLEAEDLSDARDDEIRRLKVNEYSEIMTNDIAEILKGMANGDKDLTPNSDANTVEELKALTDNTYMQSETREFLVKAEKLTTSQTAHYTESKTGASSEINAIDKDKTVQLKEMLYKNLDYLKNNMVDNRDFLIENVDLGIEYRPESEISLIKEISEIKLITEDKTVLVDLIFETESDGEHRKHYINKEKSTGVDLVQFITNDYTTKPLINNIASEEDLQGLVYIQVDQEILQGCTVEITYSFEAQNNSEVDRIATNLDEIRYKANPATTALITDYGVNIINEDKYTASGTGANVVDAEIYRDDPQVVDNEEDKIRYRIKQKLMTTTDGNGDDEYFGRYTGYSYYTGKLEKGANEEYIDTISSLKFDKILDYVDTGLKYETDTTQKDITDKLWSRVISEELVDYVYSLRPYRTEGADRTNLVLKNVDGAAYESLVVSVDDRTKDDKYSSDKDEFATTDNSTVRNNDLSRFLLPKVLVTGYLPDKQEEYNAYIDIINALSDEEKRTFTGTISLDVSKVLAAGTKDDDMTYENMAEIVQFTTLNGRRTNFATTIGNADMHRTKAENPTANPGSTEFMTATLEPDTSATETVTLIPPTGLMKNRRAIVSIMETAKTGVEVVSMTGLVVAIVAVVVLVILFIIRKYKKRRIV